MTGCLEMYLGAEVEVHYLISSVPIDKGRLSNFSPGWIELTKNAGRRNEYALLIPSSAVRLIKAAVLARTPANTLLRPAIPPDEPVEQD